MTENDEGSAKISYVMLYAKETDTILVLVEDGMLQKYPASLFVLDGQTLVALESIG